MKSEDVSVVSRDSVAVPEKKSGIYLQRVHFRLSGREGLTCMDTGRAAAPAAVDVVITRTQWLPCRWQAYQPARPELIERDRPARTERGHFITRVSMLQRSLTYRQVITIQDIDGQNNAHRRH